MLRHDDFGSAIYDWYRQLVNDFYSILKENAHRSTEKIIKRYQSSFIRAAQNLSEKIARTRYRNMKVKPARSETVKNYSFLAKLCIDLLECANKVAMYTSQRKFKKPVRAREAPAIEDADYMFSLKQVLENPNDFDELRMLNEREEEDTENEDSSDEEYDKPSSMFQFNDYNSF